jgi:polyribonucleotide nucleotidyltransferase
LVHISRLGQGKRVERVEDVLTLGQEVEVRVDEIDPQGKVSLSLAGEVASRDGAGRGGAAPGESRTDGENGGGRHAGSAADSGAASRVADETGGARRRASFEDAFESELESTYGNLGPAEIAGGPPSGGGRRAPAGGGRGGPGGSGGARRRPRSSGR